MAGGYPSGAQHDSRAPYNKNLFDCPVCNGTGSVETKYPDKENPEFEDCAYCNGTGYDPEEY